MPAAVGIVTSAQPPTAVVNIQGGMAVQPVVLVDQNGNYVTPGGSKTTAGSLATTTVPVNVAAATAPTSGQVLTATSGTTATWQTNSSLPLAGGTMTGNLELAAGTSSLAPVTFQSGTNLTAAAAGDAEFDGTAFYLTAAASSRQVVGTEQIQVLSGSYTLANNTGAQALLNATANGALTVQATTTYEFECLAYISGLSSSSHTVDFGIALGGGASLTSIFYQAAVATGAALQNAVAGVSTGTSASATPMSAATTNTNFVMILRGVMRVNAGGTITPQITQVTASAAATVQPGTLFRCWPIGSGSVTSVGDWS